ncbi:PREDICTED: matrix metalloproteinase-17 [Myotis davidii]|uniref:matrix metalloproteinase-17 n=1 Tax=Myotis davidii TaxID=225400 RepID=UPI0003EC4E75|nr:PREDICTED: matrix metalloproteinase-17 [Myotis davidii]
MVRALMHYALKVWGDITPLNFHEVAGSAADIQIDFSTADHNDRYPFDGPGGTVAHAFLPGDHHTAGDAHFDDDEAWTFRSSDAHGMDLFAVAVHEFGHAIGLSHVAATQSIMQPYYQGPVGDPLHYGLPYADRVRAWQLYGVRESVSPTAQPDTAESEEPPLLPEPPGNRPSTPYVPGKDVPHRCSAHFDAVAQIRGEAFFFKGDRYWVFQDTHVEEGFPRPVSDFGLPPGGVDAAFSWAHSDKTYFFKDQLYWRYDELTRRMDPGHPARSPPWRGVPSTLDDAMHKHDLTASWPLRPGTLMPFRRGCGGPSWRPGPGPPALRWRGFQEGLRGGHQLRPAQHFLDDSVSRSDYTHFTDGPVEAGRETGLLPAAPAVGSQV